MDQAPATIGELKRGERLDQPGVAVRAQVEQARAKQARSGSPYLEWQLRDHDDSMTLRIWDNHSQFSAASEVRSGDFIEVTALWNSNERYGLEPRDWQFSRLEAEAVKSLLGGSAATSERQEADLAAIRHLVDGMTEPRLRLLGQRFLQQFGDRLERTAAAREYHHARRGGLIEHVAQMMRTAEVIAGVYPGMHRDLLLAGALFHDCGKMWENCFGKEDFTMPFSEAAELLGHISLGIELINKLWRDLLDDPQAADWQSLEPPSDQVRLHLLHLIAAHHGMHEYGSPVLPKTPEAIALHYIDNLDAKLEMFRRGYDTGVKLSHHVVQRVRPLPANLVEPLQHPDEETEREPGSPDATDLAPDPSREPDPPKENPNASQE